jgi:putative transposase
MARPLRVDIADGWYHVTGRGIARKRIYLDDKDRLHFLELLEAVVERHRLIIHSYVLMSNHYHLVVQTPDANLSEAMQWLSVSYSMWFNRRHDRVGPLFQGRFKSIPIENSAWAYEVSLYVHLNPVMRRGLGLGKQERRAEAKGFKAPDPAQVKIRLAELRGYRWSSFRAYAGYCKIPGWLEVGELLRRAARAKDARVPKYRRDVESRLKQGVPETLAAGFKNGLALGAETFLEHIRKIAKGDRETSGKKELRSRLSFGELVKAVEKLRGLEYAEIMALRGDWGKPLILWGARAYCGMTLGAIGDMVGGMDYSAVTMAVRRFEAKAKMDKSLRAHMTKLRQEVCYVKT